MYILICRALGQAVCIAYKHTRCESLTPEATDWFRCRDRRPKAPTHQSISPTHPTLMPGWALGVDDYG